MPRRFGDYPDYLMVKRRSRVASCLAVVVSLTIAIPPGVTAQAQTAGQRAGEISQMIPVVGIQRASQTLAAAAKTPVLWADVVNTQAGARARVALDDGSVLNIGSESSVQIVKHDAGAQQTELELTYGRLRSQAAKIAKPGGKFQVRTPAGVAGVVGTNFYVLYLNGVMLLIVFEGIVQFCNLAGLCVNVSEGQTSTTRATDREPPTPPQTATPQMLNVAIQDTLIEPEIISFRDPVSGKCFHAVSATPYSPSATYEVPCPDNVNQTSPGQHILVVTDPHGYRVCYPEGPGSGVGESCDDYPPADPCHAGLGDCEVKPCAPGTKCEDTNQPSSGQNAPTGACPGPEPCEGPGKIPPGYRFNWDTKRLEPIPPGEPTNQTSPGTKELPRGAISPQRMRDFVERMRRNDQARKQGLKPGPEDARTSVPPQGATSPFTVGIVVPAQASGEFSGIITTDPKQYSGIPGLKVVYLTVPLQTGGDGQPSLQNLLVDTGNHVLQPANGPVTFPAPSDAGTNIQDTTQTLGGKTITLVKKIKRTRNQSAGQVGSTGKMTPADTEEIDVTPIATVEVPNQRTNPSPTITGTQIRRRGQRGELVVKSEAEAGVKLSGGEPNIQIIINEITTSPLCFANSIAAVHGAGRFSGDPSKIVVEFDGQPVTPFAVTTNGFFFRVPASAQEGPHQLVFGDQPSSGRFAGSTEVTVLKLTTAVEQPVLRKGQRTNGHIGLSAGPHYLPDRNAPGHIWERWAAGHDPDLIDLDGIHKVIPDFHPPQAGQPGTIFLGIQNLTPTISIAGFNGMTKSYYLTQDSLPFTVVLPIQAKVDGGFDIHVVAAPLVAPVRCWEYQVYRGLTAEERRNLKLKTHAKP